MTEYEEYYHWKLARRAEREANKPLPVKHIVILGLGFGGLEALSEAKLLLQRMPARDRRSWKITVIERSSKWMGGWANQYVMTGRRSAEECSRLYEDCLHHDVATILQDEVVELNLEERKVICRKNGTIRADYLLVALGFQAQATPLVVDKMWNICDSSHAVSAGEAIRNVRAGDSVLVCVSRLPYQCPPAPFEFVFLIHDMLVQQGVRDRVRLAISVPLPAAVPVENPAMLTELLKAKNIELFLGCQPQSISLNADGTRTVTFMPHPKVFLFNPEGKTFPVPEPFVANVLVGTWPQQAPQICLPYCNEMGLIPADNLSLRTKYENVYAIGDVNWLMLPTAPVSKPHPKAGGFSEGQARIAMRNIMSGASWHEVAPFSQDASCVASCGIETGLSEIVLATIDLHAKQGFPRFDMDKDVDQNYKKKWYKERFLKHFGK